MMKLNPEKPSWLSLRKYDESKSFTKNDWLNQISLRYLILSGIKNKINIDLSNEAFKLIEDGIYPNTNAGQAIMLKILNSNKKIYENNFKENCSNEYWVDQFNEELKNTKNIESIGLIDIAYFKKSLSGAINNKPENIKDSQLKRWAMHRIVPFIDLILWCNLNGYLIKNHGDITYNQIANWVFEDRFPYGVSRPQFRTLRKYENELMDFNLLSDLLEDTFIEI